MKTLRLMLEIVGWSRQRSFFLCEIEFQRNEDSCPNLQVDAPALKRRRSDHEPLEKTAFSG